MGGLQHMEVGPFQGHVALPTWVLQSVAGDGQPIGGGVGMRLLLKQGVEQGLTGEAIPGRRAAVRTDTRRGTIGTLFALETHKTLIAGWLVLAWMPIKPG